MATRSLFVAKTGNSKTGEIAVTYNESSTCPDSCSFKRGGCYAKGGPTAMAWRRVDQRGAPFQVLVESVAALPLGTLIRFNVAGDLPGENCEIDRPALRSLVAANKGRRGFTYTHKPLTRAAWARACEVSPLPFDIVRSNRAAIAEALLGGLTINVSCDSLAEADELPHMPCVVVLPAPVAVMDAAEVAALGARAARKMADVRAVEQAPKQTRTPNGRKVVVCPAQWRDDVTCDSCRLCSRQGRDRAVVGFWSHGYARNQVAAIVSETRAPGKRALSIVG